MYELSLNIMDIAQNSIRANARLIIVDIDIDEAAGMLRISIGDDGDGMSEEVKKAVSNPFFTTRTTRKVGLGLPYYEMTARMCGGDFSIESAPGAGTRVSASFGLNHIDRAPLGNMGQTMALLAGANPQTDFVYRLSRGTERFAYDTREIKELLGGVGIGEPEVVIYMQGYINENSESIIGGIAL